MDILDGLEKINLCVGYKYDGKVYDTFTTDLDVLKRCEPVYEEMPGWKESTVGIKELDRLPSNAKSYIKKIEYLLKTPIQIISTGPKRDEIIVLDGQF